MEVSIIIVNYNTRDYLEKCLSSIYKTIKEIKFEVIVVDNNSIDGSSEMVKSRFPEVKLVINSKNFGFAKANNSGYGKSTGDFLLFLNSDCELPGQNFLKMLEHVQEHEDVGIMGPRLIYPDFSFQPSVGRFPTFFTEIFDNLLLSKIPLLSTICKDKFDRKEYQKTVEVDWITGACLLGRRKAFEEAGKFDESFFMYMEDIDLAKRIKHKGWKVVYFPEATGIHHLGKSSEKNIKKIISVKCKSLQIYYGKYFTAFSVKLINFSSVLGLIIRTVLTSFAALLFGKRCKLKLKIFIWSLLCNLKYLLGLK